MAKVDERKYLNQNITASTTNIEKLSNALCDALECGDAVREIANDGSSKYYAVSIKSDSAITFTYNDSDKAVEVSYVKGDNGWVYDETLETEYTNIKDARIPSMKNQGGKFAQVDSEGKKFEYVSLLFEKQVQLGSASQLDIGDDGGTPVAYVQFNLQLSDMTKLINAKMIIFAMNGSFIITPLAQNGDTLYAQSFAFNDNGSTRVARVRFVKDTYSLRVNFDSDFAGACDFENNPYGVLYAIL